MTGLGEVAAADVVVVVVVVAEGVALAEAVRAPQRRS